MSDQATYDVFLSYNNADKEAVETLLAPMPAAIPRRTVT